VYNVLIIDDTDGTYIYCKDFLSDQFYFQYLRNALKLAQYLRDNKIDLILLDKNFEELPDDQLIGPSQDKHNEGLHILDRIKGIIKSIPVIMLTSYGDFETAEQAIQKGAFDYIESDIFAKGESLLRNRMLNAIRQSAKDPSDLIDKFKGLGMVGTSPIALKLFKSIEQAAKSDNPVLLTGSTGTGKDKTADVIHQLSVKADGPFINCSLPERSETIIESEFFGIEQKAATGVDMRIGYFEKSSGGTLFLNEIGEFPLGLQAKLLRVLEEKSVYRVGSVKPIEVDFKLICATNKDLKKAVKKNEFRGDLYYRINKTSINMLDLTQRKDDIPPLVHHFLELAAKKMNIEIPEISDKAINYLANQPWPGNIRQLKNTVEKLIESGKDIISLGTLAQEMTIASDANQQKAASKDRQHLNGKTLVDLEHDLIKYNYRKYNGDIEKIIQATGISRTKLYERLKKYDIR